MNERIKTDFSLLKIIIICLIIFLDIRQIETQDSMRGYKKYVT